MSVKQNKFLWQKVEGTQPRTQKEAIKLKALNSRSHKDNVERVIYCDKVSSVSHSHLVHTYWHPKIPVSQNKMQKP